MKGKLGKTGVILFSILVFVALFIYIGEKIPTMYYQNVDLNHFLKVTRMYAPDIQTDQDTHLVVFERDSNWKGVGCIISELVLIMDSGNTLKEVKQFESTEYFESGFKKIIVRFDLPDQLKPGMYRYDMILTLQLPHGVERYMSWQSNEFRVSSA